MQHTLNSESIVQQAINRIKEHEPAEGYYVAFSGGKDSIVILHLCKLAGVKYSAVYHFTSIDPKGVPQFIRNNYPEVIIEKPMYKGKRTNFYELVVLKGLPRRRIRWCCSILKEGGGEKGSTVMLGVRRAESKARSNREMFYEWNGKYNFLPIYDWNDNDVWDFIHTYNLPYPPLYDEGHKRLGCVMCPLACKASRVRDYNDYPERVRALEIAVSKLLIRNPNTSLKKWGGNDAHKIIYQWVYQSPIESAKGHCMGNLMDGDNHAV